VLGIRGSYVPSILNLIQLLGWTAFELWAMGQVANAVSKQLFGLDAYPLWLGVVGLVCTALALGGPIMVVRRWLERFGVYVVVAVGAWITFKTLGAGGTAILHRPGRRGLPLWVAGAMAVARAVL